MVLLLNLSRIGLNVLDGSKSIVFGVSKRKLIYDFSGAGNKSQLIRVQFDENSISDDEVLLSYYSPR